MNANNRVKLDNLGLFNEVDKFVSIKKDKTGSTKYEFIDLTSDEIKYLKSIVEILEKDEDVHLCARGGSKKDKHAYFLSQQLCDFFIVGNKAKFHIKENVSKSENLYKHMRMGEGLISNIEYLVNKCNDVLKKNTNRDDVSGKISHQFILDRKKESKEIQESWKIFLLGFLHNMDVNYADVKDYDFKPYSGLVSVTYGQDKYNIAKTFAADGRKKGIIYTYILRRDLKNYLATEMMYESLKNYGVECSEDSNSEMMIINGLYPHNIIGFFEIEKKSTKRFMLNYWFHRQIKDDLCRESKFDYKNGVEIKQENFQEAARRLGYGSFFTRSHVFNMVNRDIKPNIEVDDRFKLCEVWGIGGEDMILKSGVCNLNFVKRML